MMFKRGYVLVVIGGIMENENIISCSKCGYDQKQDELHLHHLVPITLGGTDLHGRRWLCKKCHSILHNLLVTQVWRFVPDADKEKAREGIRGFSLWWIRQ
jgi:ribosomal protein S27AE